MSVLNEFECWRTAQAIDPFQDDANNAMARPKIVERAEPNEGAEVQNRKLSYLPIIVFVVLIIKLARCKFFVPGVCVMQRF